MRGRIAGAEWRGPIHGRVPGGFGQPALGMVAHIVGGSMVAANNWFSNPKTGVPATGAGATFGICNGKSGGWGDGHLIQWADLEDRTWHAGAANLRFIGVETEGSGGPMTDAQVVTFARLYAECADVDGFPLVVAQKAGDPGLAYHGLGGAAWGNHLYCPGVDRIAQLPRIIELAKGPVPAPIQEDEPMLIVSSKTNNYVTNGQTKHTLTSQAEIDRWLHAGARDARGILSTDDVDRLPLSDA